MRLFLAALILACGASAQTNSSPAGSSSPASSAPGMTDEDVAAIFSRLSQRAARIEPMLEQLHPNDWIAKGAPDTYLAQWNSIREQFGAIQSDMSALAQNPDPALFILLGAGEWEEQRGALIGAEVTPGIAVEQKLQPVFVRHFGNGVVQNRSGPILRVQEVPV